jgi:hypothetical protein
MAIYAGKLRTQGVDMDEIVPFGVDLFKCFATPLRENEMTGAAIAGLNRHLVISSHMFAVVAAETSIPVLVSNKIGGRPPIDFHFVTRY